LVGWPRWRDAFAAILDARFYTLEWLDGEVAAGRATLIAGDHAAVLIGVRAYPGGAREVHGLAAAGALDEIVAQLIPAAEAWGRANGCIVATIESRPGWARALRNRGYALHQLGLRKEL
jgi:hypothetical protein